LNISAQINKVNMYTINYSFTVIAETTLSPEEKLKYYCWYTSSSVNGKLLNFLPN